MSAFPSPIQSRPDSYLIGSSPSLPAGLEPIQLDSLANEIATIFEIEINTIKLEDRIEFLEVDLTQQQMETLKQRYSERLLIEENTLLNLFPAIASAPSETLTLDPSFVPSREEELILQIVVQAEDSSQPLANAIVSLSGNLWSADGITDKSGKVILTLYGETESTLRTLYIKPANGYWSFWITHPVLKQGQDNLVYLKSLAAQFPGFPQQETLSWGQQAMKFDPAQISYRGKGVKIGIIDSGLYTEHIDLLGRRKAGHDFTRDALGWNKDTIGHGSHVAGVIGSLHQGAGMVGFAPEADVFVYKVFPGGRISDLIAALNQCIENQVDVVNLSLGSQERSELLERKIQEATNQGVACIAAAGNSATKLQYPAAFADVLAVSAIGAYNSFPEDSSHNQQIGQQTSRDGKYFTARFTCFAEDGQTMGVCAPGVAIISTVPGNPDAYACWDGTSMACPHIVGLAALILEARPDIGKMNRGRQRVEALFAAIQEGAEDLGISAAYQGKGLPNVLKALRVENSGEPQPTSPWQQLEKLLKQALIILQQELQKAQ